MSDEPQLEAVHIYINNDDLFKTLVCDSAPQSSEITLCTKAKCTVGGLPGAVISFHAGIDGKSVPVQATLTVRNLIACLTVLSAAYPDIVPQLAIMQPLPPEKGN